MIKNRAQTETVGSVLILSIIILVITLSGSLLIMGYLDETQSETPLLNIDIEGSSEGVHIAHVGGEELATEAVEVIIRNDNERKLLLNEHTQRTYLNSGYTATISTDQTGTLSVWVVDKETESVIEQDTVFIPAVDEMPVFSVDIGDVEGELTPGESIEVAYDIENSGNIAGEKTVEFNVNDEEKETRLEAIDASETNSGEFSYSVSEEDTTENNMIEVSAGNTTETSSISARFELSELEPSTIEVDDDTEEVDGSVLVTNNGTISATKDVHVEVDLRDGNGFNKISGSTKSVELESNQNKRVDFTITEEDLDIDEEGQYDYRVVTEDDEITGIVDVTPGFGVLSAVLSLLLLTLIYRRIC